MRTVEWWGESNGVSWELAGSMRRHAGRAAGGFSAFGHQRSADLEMSWQLTGSDRWAVDTVDLRLVGRSGGRPVNRTVLLERDTSGWTSRAWRRDDADLPQPGMVPGQPGILDVVIDECPLSHLPGLRRLDLVGLRQNARRGGPVPRALAGAVPVLRVLLPSLTVVPTRQRYHWVRDGKPGVLLRHAFAGGQPVEIAVDDSGVPISFGGLQRRRDSAMVA